MASRDPVLLNAVETGLLFCRFSLYALLFGCFIVNMFVKKPRVHTVMTASAYGQFACCLR